MCHSKAYPFLYDNTLWLHEICFLPPSRCFTQKKNARITPVGSMTAQRRTRNLLIHCEPTLTHFALSANFQVQSLIKYSIHIYSRKSRLLLHPSPHHIIYCCLPSLFCLNFWRNQKSQSTPSRADKQIFYFDGSSSYRLQYLFSSGILWLVSRARQTRVVILYKYS